MNSSKYEQLINAIHKQKTTHLEHEDTPPQRIVLIHSFATDTFGFIGNRLSIEEYSYETFMKFPVKDGDFDLVISWLGEVKLSDQLMVTFFSEIDRILVADGTWMSLDQMDPIYDSLHKDCFKSYRTLSLSGIEYTDEDPINITILQKQRSATTNSNIPLNKLGLLQYMQNHAKDQVVIDLLLLDLWARRNQVPIVSSGRSDDTSYILDRSYRVWEYRQIIKGLELDKGGNKSILDLGGASCHLTFYAALKGFKVTSLDINPTIIDTQKEISLKMGITNLKTEIEDMRDLTKYQDESFDMVMSASVMEHLTADDQIKSLKEIYRVLKPGGRVAVSFDYGIPAPGLNPDLPPPHDPPFIALEVIRRYVTETGLSFIGPEFDGVPYPYWDPVYYCPAFVLLEKSASDKQVSFAALDWSAKDSIMYPDFISEEDLGDFIAYFITKLENLKTDVELVSANLNYLEKDRHERLVLINKLNSQLQEIHVKLQTIEDDREDRLEVIKKQANLFAVVESDIKHQANIIDTLNEYLTIKDKELTASQEMMNMLSDEVGNLKAIISQVELDREERLQVIHKQEKIISDLEKENMSFRNSRLFKLMSRWGGKK